MRKLEINAYKMINSESLYQKYPNKKKKEEGTMGEEKKTEEECRREGMKTVKIEKGKVWEEGRKWWVVL